MSSLPGFLTALTAALDSAPALAGVTVVDGPPVDYAPPEIVAVGMSAEDLLVESATRDAGLRARREGVDVPCLARVWSGDAALPPLRDRAFALKAAVEAVLVADPTVGGTVTRARVITFVYTPIRGAEGTAVELDFRVRIDAFTS